jgi:hypothetical protein
VSKWAIEWSFKWKSIGIFISIGKFVFAVNDIVLLDLGHSKCHKFRVLKATKSLNRSWREVNTLSSNWNFKLPGPATGTWASIMERSLLIPLLGGYGGPLPCWAWAWPVALVVAWGWGWDGWHISWSLDHLDHADRCRLCRRFFCALDNHWQPMDMIRSQPPKAFLVLSYILHFLSFSSFKTITLCFQILKAKLLWHCRGMWNGSIYMTIAEINNKINKTKQKHQNIALIASIPLYGL